VFHRAQHDIELLRKLKVLGGIVDTRRNAVHCCSLGRQNWANEQSLCGVLIGWTAESVAKWLSCSSDNRTVPQLVLRRRLHRGPTSHWMWWLARVSALGLGFNNDCYVSTLCVIRVGRGVGKSVTTPGFLVISPGPVWVDALLNQRSRSDCVLSGCGSHRVFEPQSLLCFNDHTTFIPLWSRIKWQQICFTSYPKQQVNSHERNWTEITFFITQFLGFVIRIARGCGKP
jgi:hypothetical protein